MDHQVYIDQQVARLRRQRRQYRHFGWVAVPLFFAVVVVGRSPWVALPAFLLTSIVWQILGIRAYTQMCPRCHASLTIERVVSRSLPPSCPVCGLAID